MNLSPSKIITYLQCPMRFKLEYIDKLRSESTELRGGRAVHAAAKALVDDSTWQFGDWKDKIWTVGEAIFLHHWNKSAVPEEDGAKMGAYGEMFGTYVRALSQRIERNAVKTTFSNAIKWALPKATEQWMTVKEPVAIRGIVDEVSGNIAMSTFDGLWIIDLKTGKVPDVPFKWDYWLQLQLYALMYYEKEGKLPAGLALWFLADNVWVIHETDFDSLNEVAAWAEYVAEQVDVENFTPCKSGLCPWCVGYKGGCPVGNTRGV